MRFQAFTRVIILSLGAMASSVQACLGETEFECNDRYGDGEDDRMKVSFPLVNGARHREFHFMGWLIRIAFVEGHAVREECMKSGSKDGPLIKDDEVQAILEGEKGAGTWKVKPEEGYIAGLAIFSSGKDLAAF